ncbi:hypothetical protein HanIR_Chr17g0862001 [Helianthus annuus]|nr:hypothetical protein HanIR_Chr17g0862001 [Helianthus annuus]
MLSGKDVFIAAKALFSASYIFFIILLHVHIVCSMWSALIIVCWVCVPINNTDPHACILRFNKGLEAVLPCKIILHLHHLRCIQIGHVRHFKRCRLRKPYKISLKTVVTKLHC